MPMVRERPSLAPRQFIEITPTLRRALEALVEAGIAALDEIDAPTEDLEDGADDEPSFGWSHHEAMRGRHIASLDEGEEDDPAEDSEADEDSDPAEDGHDDEPEPMDAEVTRPDTSCGMGRAVRIYDDWEEAMALRESFDPRFALRPAPSDRLLPLPPLRFPHEPADRPLFDGRAEKRRLRWELAKRPRGRLVQQ